MVRAGEGIQQLQLESRLAGELVGAVLGVPQRIALREIGLEGLALVIARAREKLAEPAAHGRRRLLEEVNQGQA